jgi:hypothetical protein
MLAVMVHASRDTSGLADLSEAPRLLSETGLYADGRVGKIDARNRLFSPQYPLWTDGLAKRRWIQLPEGAAIDGRDESAWRFPVGTKLWKEFSRAGQPIETRMLWRASEAGWVLASYVWKADGSDAELAPDTGIPDVAEVAPGRRHSIPSRTDCAACHGIPQRAGPIGFTALQLSTDRDPNALHGEPLSRSMLSNRVLVDEGLLVGARGDLLTTPPRIQTRDAATRTVLGYLVANCGMCHNGNGEIAALGPVIRVSELITDADGVAHSLIGQPTRWQAPTAAPGETVLVHPGAPERSAIYLRMRSRSPSSQMPPLGTRVRDEKAVEAIGQWIAAMPRSGLEAPVKPSLQP